MHCSMLLGLMRGKEGILKHKGQGCTDGIEGVAQLQIESIDRHVIADRQHRYSGQVAGWVGHVVARGHRIESDAGACEE